MSGPIRARNYWSYAGPFLFNPREASRIFFGKSRDWLIKIDGTILDQSGDAWFPSRNEHEERHYTLDDIRTIALGLVRAKRLHGYKAKLILDVIDSMELLWQDRLPE